MNKKTTIILSLITLYFLCAPVQAFALNVYFDKSVPEIIVGKSTTLKAYIDTEGQEINVIEGVLEISDSVSIGLIDKSNSAFNLWTEEPAVDGNKISFTGGVEGGLYGKNVRLFDIVLTPSSIGEISITPKGLGEYLNDGKGTYIAGSTTPFTIKVVDELQNITQNPSNPKLKPFVIVGLIVLVLFFVLLRVLKKKKNV